MRFPPTLLYKWLPKSTMVTGLGSSLAKGGRGEGPKAWGGGRMLKSVGRVEVLWGSKGSIHHHPNPCSPCAGLERPLLRSSGGEGRPVSEIPVLYGRLLEPGACGALVLRASRFLLGL